MLQEIHVTYVLLFFPHFRLMFPMHHNLDSLKHVSTSFVSLIIIHIVMSPLFD